MPNNPKALRFFEGVEAASVPASPLQQASPHYPVAGAGGKPEPESPLLARKTPASPITAAAPKTTEGTLVKRDLTTALVLPPTESVLLQQLRILKAECHSLNILFKQIHTWLSLSLRPFDDEDADHNQACSIILGNLPGMMETTKSVYDLETKYLETKYELEIRQLRHPACPSLKKGFEVLVGNTWDDVEKGWRMMIRSCLLLHALLSKNMKSLRDPRGGKLNLKV
jgi:hypothetical protein